MSGNRCCCVRWCLSFAFWAAVCMQASTPIRRWRNHRVLSLYHLQCFLVHLILPWALNQGGNVSAEHAQRKYLILHKYRSDKRKTIDCNFQSRKSYQKVWKIHGALTALWLPTGKLLHFALAVKHCLWPWSIVCSMCTSDWYWNIICSLSITYWHWSMVWHLKINKSLF